MGFLKFHIRRKGANISLGFDTISTKQHDESRGSTTDGDSLECSVCGSLAKTLQAMQTTLPLQSSTSVSTDSRIIEHFEQIQTFISDFLQQKSTSERQPFYDYVAEKLTRCLQKNMRKNFKVLVFNAIQNIKSTSRRQVLPRGQTLLQLSHRRLRYCHQQHSLPSARRLQPVVAATVSTTH